MPDSRTNPRLISYLLAILMPLSGLWAQPIGFSDQVYSSGFQSLIGLTFDELGRAFVWEKDGRIYAIEDGLATSQPILDLRAEVADWRDFGLLSVALDPDFLTNGYLYLLYVVDHAHLYKGNPDQDQYAQSFGRITRYQVSNPQAGVDLLTVDPASRQVLVGELPSTGFPATHQSHQVGALVFGTDGTLLASCGDAASYNVVDEGGPVEGGWVEQALTDGILQPEEDIGAYRCQYEQSLNGKLIRIDPTTGEGLPSNPHYDALQPRSAGSRLWARGLRNPFRMALKPGSGSLNPAEGNPGILLIGDVGWVTREEINLCDAPDQNFGWPWYEGMDPQGNYADPQWEPGTHGLPAHTPPLFDWRNGQIARVLRQGTAYNMGEAGTPVSGNSFVGNCSLGGTWYTGTSYPAEYANSYFHADYVSGWVQRFVFDEAMQPLSVEPFLQHTGDITALAMNPVDGNLYYVNRSNVVRKIMYSPDNQSPRAVAIADQVTGRDTLTVSFRGNRSSDADGDSLSYHWDFGDGASSTAVNPVHTFSTATLSPRSYSVTLTVRDSGSQGVDSLVVSLNNSPPVILSTSIDEVSVYRDDTTLMLSAAVVDAEDAAEDLRYEWQTFLYHDTHNHAETPIKSANAQTVLTPVGCDGVLYFFRIRLTVTDSDGLSTWVERDIYPDCGGDTPPVARFQVREQTALPPSYTFDGANSYDLDGPLLRYAWDLGDGTTANGSVVNHRYFEPGSYAVSLTVMDEEGHTDQASGTVSVSCGQTSSLPATGSIGYEKWAGIGGVNLDAIDFEQDLPDEVDRRAALSTLIDTDDDYGMRLRGYLHPPQTGSYTFGFTSDDEGQLYLSTDDDPAHAVLITAVPDWAMPTEWDKYPTQTATVTLEAGQRYYFEGRMKEAGGGDHLIVRWTLPDGSMQDPIPGEYLSPWNGGPYPNLWTEDFALPAGLAQDSGATRWVVDMTQAGEAAVVATADGSLQASETEGEVVWTSEAVVMDQERSAQVQVDIRSQNALSPTDYIRVLYRTEAGTEQLVASRSGNFNADQWETVSAEAISGDSLWVIVRTRLGEGNAQYLWDNVRVRSNGPNTGGGPPCIRCATQPAEETALRGQHGACVSNQVNDWLEIQDEYDEALLSLHDQKQSLGKVTVETYDHGESLFFYDSCFHLNRSFYVETAHAPSAPVLVRLYLLPSEWELLSATDPTVSSLSDLTLARYSDGELGGVGIGQRSLLRPTDVGFGQGPNGSHWVEFSVRGFSTFFLQGSATGLAARWLAFDAEPVVQDAHLSWSVVADGQGSHFDVERSTDGRSFRKVGRVDMQVGVEGKWTYEWVDAGIGSFGLPQHTYRLAQVDLEGLVMYSPLRSVRWLQPDEIGLTLFPNPANEQLMLRYTLQQPEAVSLLVMDATGRKVYHQQLGESEGPQAHPITVSNWARGVYWVQVLHATGSTQRRFRVD